METPSKKPLRASGLPRPSRVPLPSGSRDLNASSQFATPQKPFASSAPKHCDIQAYASGRKVTHTGHDEELGLDANTARTSESRLEADLPPRHRRPRPSLSDRTVETLAQIPPSPSPARRRSSFFTAQSPMTSPIRPRSAMHEQRPRSSRGDVPPVPKSYRTFQPLSPVKQPNSPASHRTSSSIAGKKSDTFSAPRVLPPSHRKVNGMNKAGHGSSSNDGSRMHVKNNDPSSSGIVRKEKAETRPKTNATTRASTIPNRRPFAAGVASKPSLENLSGSPMADQSASPKSSAALRDTIARAKAAHRATSTTQRHAGSKMHGTQNTFREIDLGESSRNVMTKRIAAARRQGRLNIAAIGLKQLPTELLSIYNGSALEDDGGSWAESVDLVKLCAADNEIEELDKTFFDGDREQSDGTSPVFQWLETLDLHGNLLTSLPSGFEILQHLTILDLSRNKLETPSLDIISHLQGLRELRLAGNRLQDISTLQWSSLPALEVLDLSKNTISTISDAIGELTSLHTLILNGNKLSSIPEGIFCRMHLRELQVARNSLKGTLIPISCQRLECLRTLDVSYNAITSVSDASALALPSLIALDVSENRLKALPNLSGVPALTTLVADGNQLSELPHGLTDLEKLKNVNLSRNDLRQLNTRIGFIENLSIFSIANNPIRERRLLMLNAEDLKRELREREGETDSTEQHGIDESNNPMSNGRGASSCKAVQLGGTLNLSSAKLETVDKSMFENLAEENKVKTLVLKHNKLGAIPQAIETFGATLVMLDLSDNKLNKDTYLTETIELPRLKNLDLAANGLSSLAPLLMKMSAAALSDLNVSRNRLTDLPVLRPHFPSLTTVMAAENKISELPFESVQGLHVLDVGGNDIGFLEPRIGLLGREGLRMFLVGTNTFRVPRRDVVEKGTEAILTWLRGRIPD